MTCARILTAPATVSNFAPLPFSFTGGPDRPRVLIAEDEGLLAEELRHRLTRLGAEVVGTVATGEDAITLAGQTAPQVAFMDIRLKGHMDGIEAAAAIGERFSVPVIFLTAHADDATISRAKRVRPYGYLLKPVNERELKVTLAMVLHKHTLEQQLRTSELRYETTLMSIGDGVVATDAEGRVTFINPVAEALTRWAHDEAIGRPAGEVFTLRNGQTGDAVPDPIVSALDEQAIVVLPAQTVLVARDGTTLPIDDSVAPIRDHDGRVRGAVAVFRVETQDGKTLERLRHAEERLRQAEKLESLGRLAGGIAHDINNMMTVIVGCADLVLEKMPQGEPSRALLHELKSAADRSTSMVRQLLAFSRTQVLSPVVLDVRAVIADLQIMLRRLIESHVEILYTLRDEDALVRVDRSQLEQVIINLALNARDAMPNGGRLTIECGPVEVDTTYAAGALELIPGPYVMLSVGDTGFGMDPVTRSRVFEPFFTTKDAGKGTGLGLATVYGVVKQSGGHIHVYSEMGEGTLFKVYLPREAAPLLADLPAATAVSAGPARGTILLAEDDDAVRHLVTSYLTGAGYTVLAAADGREALDRLDVDPPPIDLLLTDVVMPNMGGRALAATLRPRFPEMRVLFMSGYTEDRILRQGIAAEEVAYIQKPFSASSLLDRVRTTLARAEPQA
jgi:two-component system cell cycle sensor histidine kinase/response regulator CckA